MSILKCNIPKMKSATSL